MSYEDPPILPDPTVVRGKKSTLDFGPIRGVQSALYVLPTRPEPS